MKRSLTFKTGRFVTIAGVVAGMLWISACKKSFNPASGMVQQAKVVEVSNGETVAVPHPENFKLTTAEAYQTYDTLNVTGSVNPDVSREVPVISLASGKVVDIRARLDDNVKKGQLLLRVQSPDITNAFDTYLKAVNDEKLANKAYVRAKDLYAHGAIAQSMLEQADDTEQDALADLKAAEQQLQVLGADKNRPTTIEDVYAPISGVIVAQNVTNAAAAGVNFSGSSTAFTIADLSKVWVICDVYENDLHRIQLGQKVMIHPNAFADKVLHGTISDIGPILDPNIRTAKVRIEVENPDRLLKLGMFVTATIDSLNKKTLAVIPATAVLHLHDEDWVYVPTGDGRFRRVQVDLGDSISGGRQEILSGIAPGQQMVGDILQLEATLEAQ